MRTITQGGTAIGRFEIHARSSLSRRRGAATTTRAKAGAGLRNLIGKIVGLASAALILASPSSVRASTAYGTLNNFDCVNDTGVEAHGFDIELEDVHSRDITYTYDYNHYGAPKITEDNSDPLHPRVLIRYAANRNPDGTWSAYTAIPSGPIAPTQGHQFTDPSINFGGEHFGAGYYGAPSAVRYFWLIDDGTGNLVRGQPVYVATPTFVYYPPAQAQPVPQVQAVIVPPPPPEPPVLQFGVATWVKDIKTTTHNSNKIELVDLVDPDPDDPNAANWANGEPTEVETEWRLLQTEFSDAGNPKGELKGLPEDLPEGDEVITRRYEFYKYVGPIDVESGEAVADEVAADGIHGSGVVTYNASFDPMGEPVEETVDLSTVVVVGDFIGAQMSGFDIAPALGLIDHVPDGEVNVPYAERTVVVSGGAAFFAAVSGALPDGTAFDGVTGIFSGTPTVPGSFTFTIDASDLNGGAVSKTYTVVISESAVVPITSLISTSSSPVEGGNVVGSGTYENGTEVTVVATPNLGYRFINWTEGLAEVSAEPSYSFIANGDRILVAHFAPISYRIATSSSPIAGGATSGGGDYAFGADVSVLAEPNVGYSFLNWTEGGAAVSGLASYAFVANADRNLVAHFEPIAYSVNTSASPNDGGTTSGGGTFNHGENVTVLAEPNAGYSFVNWTEGGGPVSDSASYAFTANASRDLVANFIPIPAVGTIKSVRLAFPSFPVKGGSQTVCVIELSARAPTEGTTVRLTSSNPEVLQVPSSVKVAPRRKSALVVATTFPVVERAIVSVTAQWGDSQQTCEVEVIPR